MHPDLLPHVTPIVLSALTSPEIALYATMALKDMSRDCAAGMKPYSEVRLHCLEFLRGDASFSNIDYFYFFFRKLFRLVTTLSNRDS